MSPMNESLCLIGCTDNLGMEVAKGLVTAEGYEPKKAIVRDADSAKPPKPKPSSKWAGCWSRSRP